MHIPARLLHAAGGPVLLGLALLVAPSVASAQTTGARPAGPVPEGRVAVINIGLFPEQVFEYKRKIQELNALFEPRTKELRALADNITALEAQAKQGTASAEQLAQLADRYETMKRDYKRKSEDLQAEGEKAYTSALVPIRSKMTQFLQGFAKQRGIVLVLEVSSALKSGTAFYIAKSADITDEFVVEYNKANP